MKKIVASLLVVVLLVSGCSFFKKSPQAAVNEGIANFANIKKLTSTLLVNGTINLSAGKAPVQIALSVESSSDASDAANPKTDTIFKVNASAEGTAVSADMLVRVLNKNFYANLAKLDVSGEAGTAIKDQLKGIFDVWWFFPVSGGESTADNLQAKQKQIMQKFQEAQFFTNAVEEGSETVGGVSATKYSVALDKVAVKKFLVEVIALVEPESKLTAEEEAQMEKDLQNVEFSGAVWVGEDEFVHRIKGVLTYQPTDPTGATASVDIDYTGSNYGEDVTVVAPESPREFNPVALIPLLGAFGALSSSEAPETPVTPPAVE